MIKSYLVYRLDTGEILKKRTCPPKQGKPKVKEGLGCIEGNVCDSEYKVVDGELVKYTQEEKNVREFQVKKILFPGKIRANLTDEELDAVIDKFYLGQMDVEQWKKDNYSKLREIFYPSYGEFLGAEVKINTGKKVDGDKEKENYFSKCEQVKLRFPKENKK